MIKIGYFADGPWSHKAIEYISHSNLFKIVFIVPRYDIKDPVLAQWANKLDVPFLVCKNVNDASFLEEISKYEADIFISMSFNQILKKSILLLPPMGFLNCHAGALPFYRGRNPLNWVLINGEKSFGITAHFIDEGIDTGPILHQEHFSIRDDDNYGTLLELAVIKCAEVLIKGLNKIADGNYKLVEQGEIHPVGTYFSQRKQGDELVSFFWDATRFHNFVRALSAPSPEARFRIGAKEFSIVRTELIPGAPNYISTEGEVVGRNHNGIIVKVADKTLLINLIRDLNSIEHASFTPQFPIGTRLEGRK